ncbi:MAG TPA: 2-oxoacid:acceptor oxidoreductase family protein [Acidimicrobiales bacterium]|jgi:2-oxoglutarate ferredoxin oxidoreductase subunit gamma|nr:2-oxoacid:acceptor oxidoreductase family protein [Acidimicrobiales bacterium]
MQVEVMMTGVGGQGIQLCSKTLAQAAVLEGRQAMLCGHYAGAIRGGQTDASIVVADGESKMRALPILPSAWAGFVMSPQYWESTREFLRPGGPVVVNSSLVDEDFVYPEFVVSRIPAGEIAAERLGAPMGASMVLLGAFCATTGIVGIDALVAAMKELVPPYRTEHVVANEKALRTGVEEAGGQSTSAWERTTAVSGAGS